MTNDAHTFFYISTKGNAAWSGHLPEPNRDGTDGPFAAITQARDAIRRLDDRHVPVTVFIRGGTYYLDDPISFASEDSGRPRAPIVYEAYPGEVPVLSGGIRLTGWQETQINGQRAWVTEAPSFDFHQLWINDQRRYRPRLPKQGLYPIKGISTGQAKGDYYTGYRDFYAEPGHVRKWKNLNDVEIVALTAWIQSRLPIESVDDRTGLVKTRLRSVLAYATTGYNPSRFYVENVFEALDTPGLWYHDRPEGKLYYLPLPEEHLDTAVIVVPRLTSVLVLKDEPATGRPVEHLHFRGLFLAHTEWWRSSTTSIMRWEIHDGPQGRRVDVRHATDDLAGDAQCDVSVVSAIVAVGARHCRFDRCTVAHIGNYAIELGLGCANNDISRCECYDLGAGGVKLGTQSAADAPVSGFNRVTDCEIHNGGLIYHGAVGIWLGETGNNTIAHNHVHDLYYSGISIGWTWGYQESGTQNNLIEYNHVHDLGKGWLFDMGGIYTLGVSPGTVIRYNVVHDIRSDDFGACGLYHDEGSSNILSEFNLVYRCQGHCFHQNYGRENVLRNNIFAWGPRYQLTRGREDGNPYFTMEHNIVFFREGELLGGQWADGKYRMRQNLYWCTDPGKLKFGPWTWAEWRDRGNDAGSLIADPLFADPENGDFTLNANSPAFSIGFLPFDISAVGPRGPIGTAGS